MAIWHLAPSLVKLQKELDAEFGATRPNDGTIGDASHAARKSEHNPDNDPDPMPLGAVSAIDVYTKDGAGKTWVTAAQFTKILAAFKKDSRVWYVIHKGFIYSRTHNFEKRAYEGENSHENHFHLSLMQTKAAHDSTTSWGISKAVDPPKPPAPPKPVLKPLPTLSRGDRHEVLVPFLKRFLGKLPNDDAAFGKLTEARVKVYQKDQGLKVDGVVGDATWKRIASGGTKLPEGYRL